MRLLRTKVWYWWDVWMLKWCCLLFGMVVGAYIADIVKGYIWWFVVGAILLAIRPAITYFRD